MFASFAFFWALRKSIQHVRSDIKPLSAKATVPRSATIIAADTCSSSGTPSKPIIDSQNPSSAVRTQHHKPASNIQEHSPALSPDPHGTASAYHLHQEDTVIHQRNRFDHNIRHRSSSAQTGPRSPGVVRQHALSVVGSLAEAVVPQR